MMSFYINVIWVVLIFNTNYRVFAYVTPPITSVPTSSPVTSIPTSSPITSVPTSSPITSVPTSSPITSVPTSSPSISTTFLPTTSVPTVLSDILWIEDKSVNESKKWISVAMSDDGKIQTALENDGYIWKSNDFGATWYNDTNITNPQSWWKISMSNDGTIQTAIVMYGYIWKSLDSGATWSQHESIQMKNWVSVAMNGNGTIQIALEMNGFIWRSNDTGVTWYNNTNMTYSKNWQSVDMNNNGSIQTAVATSEEYIWRSFDFGITWIPSDTSFVLSSAWRSVAVSGDGMIQTAVEYEGYIWTSTDYGATWINNTNIFVPLQWIHVVINYNGAIQTAIVYDGNIWSSKDYGITWTNMNLITNGIFNIAINHDGTIQTAVAYEGNIWTSNTQRIYSVDKYYPLIMNEEHASLMSPTGGAHTHNLYTQIYWMPNTMKKSHGEVPDFLNHNNDTKYIFVDVGEPLETYAGGFQNIFVNGLGIDLPAQVDCQRGDFLIVNVSLLGVPNLLLRGITQNNYETIYNFNNTDSNITTFIMNEVGTIFFKYFTTSNHQGINVFTANVQENSNHEALNLNYLVEGNNYDIYNFHGSNYLFKACIADTHATDYNFEYVHAISESIYNVSLHECAVACKNSKFMGRQSYGICLCSNQSVSNMITNYGISRNCVNGSQNDHDFFGHSATLLYEIESDLTLSSSVYSTPKSTVPCGETDEILLNNVDTYEMRMLTTLYIFWGHLFFSQKQENSNWINITEKCNFLRSERCSPDHVCVFNLENFRDSVCYPAETKISLFYEPFAPTGFPTTSPTQSLSTQLSTTSEATTLSTTPVVLFLPLLTDYPIRMHTFNFSYYFKNPGIYTMTSKNYQYSKQFKVTEGCTLEPTQNPTKNPSKPPTSSYPTKSPTTKSPIMSTTPPTTMNIAENEKNDIDIIYMVLIGMGVLILIITLFVIIKCVETRKSGRKKYKKKY